MHISTFLERLKLRLNQTPSPLPDWAQFLIKLGYTSSRHKGLFCCVIVPDVAFSSLLLTLGAHIKRKTGRLPKEVLNPGSFVYVESSGDWFRGRVGDTELINGSVFYRIEMDETGLIDLIPEEQVFSRIKPAKIQASNGVSWLNTKKKKLSAQEKKAINSASFSSDTTTIVSRKEPLLRAVQEKYFHNNDKLVALDSWLILEEPNGVNARTFNVSLEQHSTVKENFEVWCNKIPTELPPQNSSTICCIDAGYSLLEDRTQEFITHFVKSGTRTTPVLQLLMNDGKTDLCQQVPNGISFCGIERNRDR